MFCQDEIFISPDFLMVTTPFRFISCHPEISFSSTFSIWDTECYRGIKPVADGHAKARIGTDADTSSIASPLV